MLLNSRYDGPVEQYLEFTVFQSLYRATIKDVPACRLWKVTMSNVGKDSKELVVFVRYVVVDWTRESKARPCRKSAVEGIPNKEQSQVYIDVTDWGSSDGYVKRKLQHSPEGKNH